MSTIALLLVAMPQDKNVNVWWLVVDLCFVAREDDTMMYDRSFAPPKLYDSVFHLVSKLSGAQMQRCI